MSFTQSGLSHRPTPLKLDRWSVVFFAAVHGVALLSPWFFSWSALGMTLSLHWLFGSIGVSWVIIDCSATAVFRSPAGWNMRIALIGALALQGGPIFWVAGHRLHHAYTEDEDKDPYSARRGFWWSHMLWIFYPRAEFFEYEQYKRFAPDLARDPYYRWLNRYFLLLQLGPAGTSRQKPTVLRLCTQSSA